MGRVKSVGSVLGCFVRVGKVNSVSRCCRKGRSRCHNTQQNYTKQDCTQHNDAQHKGLINDTQHNETQDIGLNYDTQNHYRNTTIMLSVTFLLLCRVLLR
jgi:hypothetical protein